ncbi:MAG: BA14K family protein [Sinorhizobium meliloti]|uniref:Lectin-like protein BA14k n=1 Tax=Rhizobium meliloti TaxID=382 RepID=A0A2J0Z828_RHIML|nr:MULTISPECIES: BA14K family protein [Sinorhizobium]PND19907.1 BA14K family protein [Ensifer sp. MMN_5]GCA48804.1 lectin-like protein BA14k precursor [Sinorhizobium sp. KGO-5]MCG5485066.1 BA14K family protein [Sinorhizobium meliloti]PJR16681.1 BA14K family protein [Sinorhizobium meliloti]PND27966.1 BA14K family protein [Sinorhizobium sp. M4_45]
MSLKWLSGALAAMTLAASAVPSQAFTPLPPRVAVESAVTDVQYAPRRGYYRYGDFYYYNGYRGYRYQRPGYRYYRGWWYPGAAFRPGIVIERRPAVRPPVRYGSRHVQWCYDRYRSYRAYDNSYQPYNGPRRQCYSPYS